MTLLPYQNNNDPSANIQEREFNDVSIKFGSYLSMTQNKCLNHIATIALIMKNAEMKKIYLLLLGSDNIFNAIQMFIQNTPNLYKKVAKKTIFK